ncbi:hypothetical protein Droror1_Dr00021778 [Drosera rotundifolia]
MVEMKRVIPEELSPSPNRSRLVGYSYGLNRASTLMNNYGQGYNLNSIGGYGRFNPITSSRSALPPLAAGGYGMDLSTVSDFLYIFSVFYDAGDGFGALCFSLSYIVL